MRKNTDVPSELRFAAAVADLVADSGDTTLVNGVKYGLADWTEQSANKFVADLDQDEMAFPIYAVLFPGTNVLGAPWNLVNGSRVTWVAMNWSGVVRKVSPDTSRNTVMDVSAVVVITSNIAAYAANDIKNGGFDVSVYRPSNASTRTVTLLPINSELDSTQFLPEGGANQSAATKKLFHALPGADIKQGDVIRQFPPSQPYDWRVLDSDVQFKYGIETKIHVWTQRNK